MDEPVAKLPRPRDGDGAPRRVGIEVECGGVTEQQLAEIVSELFGGTIEATSRYVRVVRGTRIGDVEVLLDTKLRDRVESDIAQAGLDLGRAVIPVEFVTEPIEPAGIPAIDALCRTLAAHGAYGTQNGIALGFGVHLNVGLPGTGIGDVLPVLRAFALTEDWLRGCMSLDPSRRVLPFVDPYPAALVDRLCAPEADGWTLSDLTEAYLSVSPTRNHALDMLPILKLFDAERVVDAVPAMAHKTARPAWHYRLPDCRIDDPKWSITREWARWCRMERFASDPALIDDLMARWRGYRDRTILIPGRWAGISGEIIEASGAL